MLQIMGAGKTTVIGPLLAMMLSGAATGASSDNVAPDDSGLLVIQCVPAALLEMSISVMRSVFNNIIDKDVLTLTFKRTLDPKVNTAEIMYQKVLRAHREQSIICTTPDVVKSIFLKYTPIIASNTKHDTKNILASTRLPA